MKTSAQQRLKRFERQTQVQLHAASILCLALVAFALGLAV